MLYRSLLSFGCPRSTLDECSRDLNAATRALVTVGACFLLFGSMTAYALATLIVGIPGFNLLEQISGRLLSATEQCETVRFGTCYGYFELTVEGQRHPWRIRNGWADHGLPQVGLDVVLWVRPDSPIDELSGWRNQNIWQIEQNGDVLLPYTDLTSAALTSFVTWMLVGLLCGALAAICGGTLVLGVVRSRRGRHRYRAH